MTSAGLIGSMEAQFRQALTDDLRWVILTSDDEGRSAAATWLRSSLTAVKADRRALKTQKAIEQAALPAHTRAWHQVHVRWVEQDARALALEAMLKRRLDALTTNTPAVTAFPAGGAAVERQRRRAERIDAEMKHAINSLADLASLVEAHVAGTTTLAELDQALDDLTVVASGDSTVSLRQLLAGKRAKYSGVSA